MYSTSFWTSALDFIKKNNINKIYEHENSLLKYLHNNLENIENVSLYTNFYDNKQHLAPILSFNVKNMHSEEVAEELSSKGICVRAGFHCAPLAHKKFGTENTGTVRISPSIFTKKSDIDFLIKSVIKIAKLN